MSDHLPKAYEPGKYEDEIYRKWEDSGFFDPDKLDLPEDAPPYTIVLPPPNITDKLHLGHASMLAIEDLLIRFHRMNGYRALWVPGTDHAAIATQNVVEKKLLAEEGKTRHDLGRERFLEKVWEFLRETQTTILKQTRKMGASLDWSRTAFTLDEEREKAVRRMFVDMYEAGVIYRGERIVNWCPRCHSTLADDEVEYKEQAAKLYTFKYSPDFPFTIATTRPETKLGDTAVAVNPKDKRYKDFVGKTYEVEFAGMPLKLRIIADREIDTEFGTGALGVTPAHAMADWRMAEENGLPVVKVIDEDGLIRPEFGRYAGKPVKEARALVVERLREAGLLEREEEVVNNLSICYRCSTPVEPLPSKQWFVAVDKPVKHLGGKSLKEKAIEAAKKGDIKFIPDRFGKRYLHWMENLHDWCISRQIWFGHRIPVWYRQKSKIKDQRSKLWQFKLYGEDTYNNILKGTKRFETRAGRERSETGKNWEDLRPGDIIEFSLVSRGKEEVLRSGLKKKIVKTYHFDSIDKMLEKLDLSEISPESNIREYENKMMSYPGFRDRIKQYGVWAFELSGLEEPEIYVGEEAPEGGDWEQDPDSLDTWFSSGMWTFSTLDWPSSVKTSEGEAVKTGDLARFHPTQVLETGYEILTLWVSRMIMMSFFALDEVPFENVYLHGMVLDKHGKKMSKSKGNGIDPLDVIAEFGTDAVRLSLLIGATPGNDVRIFEERIAGFRNFVNKLWNVSRYILSNYELGSNQESSPTSPRLRGVKITNYEDRFSLIDNWILAKLHEVIRKTTEDIENYQFSQAGERLREFIWNDLADWYVEAAKFEQTEEKKYIFKYILKCILKLSHPFIPFVTERIWSELGEDKLLMISDWPKEMSNVKCQMLNVNDFDLIKDIITAIRNMRAENKVEPGRKIEAVIHAGNKKEIIESQAAIIKGLRTGIDKMTVKEGGDKLDGAIYAAVGDIEIYLLGAVDPDKEKKRLIKEIENKKKVIKSAEAKLSNEQFTSKAPEAVVNKQKENLAARQEEFKKLEEQLESLG